MATTWKIDTTHSEVQFKVKHLMITTVTGQFNEFEAQASTTDDQFEQLEDLHFSAKINSISTNNEQRDGHLKSGDFFDAEKYPTLDFKSTSVEKDGSDWKVKGNLTIKDVTKPITFNVEFGGIVVDPYGQTKAGFTVNSKISRKEFNLTWNAVTEAGAVVVSDEVKLLGEIQFIKQ